jgi:hypothetical protein
VSKVDRLAEHERASSNDTVETRLLALTNSLGGYATRTKRPMKPDLAYTAFSTLPHNFNRHIRMCGNNQAVDGLRQRENVWIAGGSLGFRGSWVDSKNLVAGVSQPSVYSVGRLASVSGHPSNANSLTAKELVNGMRDLGHG